MNTFESLHRNMASILLPNVTNDIVSDCSRAFKTSYLRKPKPEQAEGKPGRLSGWAIVKEGMLILQSDLAFSHAKLHAGDTRTRYEAWSAELENFVSPTCFLEFTHMSPGSTGTSIFAWRARSTNSKYFALSKNNCVVTKCAPVSTLRFKFSKSMSGEGASGCISG